MNDNRRCTATAKATGERCKRAAAPGGTVCVKHGGGAPQVRAAAARRVERQAAEAELAAVFGAPLSEADPVETVINEIRHCAGHVQWLRAKVAELPTEDLVWV